MIPNKNYAFVTFKCDEDRQHALTTLDKYQWKGKMLFAKVAKPIRDPVEKKKEELGDSSQNNPIMSNNSQNNDDLDIFSRLRNAVTPLWNKSYGEQMTVKYEAMVQFLKKLAKQLLKADVGPWVLDHRKQNGGMCCPLEKLLPSPVLDAYRNKCEFTIGEGVENVGKVVGFRLGMYKDGNCTVVEPKECTNIPESMKQVLQEFQSFIKLSPLAVFNPTTHDGFWKQLTVRTTCKGDMMCILQIASKNMAKTDVQAEVQKLAEHFGQQEHTALTSLYVDVASTSSNNATVENSLEHVWGEKFIFESMCGMTFRISPDAFFQVNTKAAEVLYQTVRDWSEVTSETLILDICCGTGTIGLSMAKLAKRVVGVEVCQAAVEDAIFNAASNGITNAKFICGKAEDVIIDTTSNLKEASVVGIVDPPRAGCHGKVIQAIRRCSNLKRLIYISCSPNSVIKDFVDLCRPVSKRTKGEPFRIVKAVPVDLFPQTSHCELIVLLERT